MLFDIIIYYIKIFFMNMFMNYSYCKILNIKNIKLNKKITFILINSILIGVCTYIKFFISSFWCIIILCVINTIVNSILYKNKLGISFITTFISYAVDFVCFEVSIILVYLLYKVFRINNDIINLNNDFVNLPIILILNFLLLYKLLKIKKFKNGFDFLYKKFNNELTDILIVNISIEIILVYCLAANIINDEMTKKLLIIFSVLGCVMFIMIQKTLTMYYKQKLLEDTLEGYKKEIEEKDKEIAELKNEKYKISKITHEFFNRQKALELAVTSKKQNTELKNRIKNLTEEYSTELTNMKIGNKLPLTNIPEIDDMFSYMQKECMNNNIKFQLKIEGDIFYLIKNSIPKNRLETLIGDHIRDAINAVRKNDSDNKKILVILGIKNNCYEFCVYDTGIEFEIDTLLKLGLERVTTNAENGGNGIGFITTFETMKQTGASLIIQEFNNNQFEYTKSVKIRFDNKNEYKIYSYRTDKIIDNSNRIIIEKLET